MPQQTYLFVQAHHFVLYVLDSPNHLLLALGLLADLRLGGLAKVLYQLLDLTLCVLVA